MKSQREIPEGSDEVGAKFYLGKWRYEDGSCLTCAEQHLKEGFVNKSINDYKSLTSHKGHKVFYGFFLQFLSKLSFPDCQ